MRVPPEDQPFGLAQARRRRTHAVAARSQSTTEIGDDSPLSKLFHADVPPLSRPSFSPCFFFADPSLPLHLPSFLRRSFPPSSPALPFSRCTLPLCLISRCALPLFRSLLRPRPCSLARALSSPFP
eukprot:4092997-Pleurochrysis_carterae.AAC.1